MTMQVVSVTGRRQLHSSDIDAYLVQWTNTRPCDRSFTAAGPRVWNSLATQLRESNISVSRGGGNRWWMQLDRSSGLQKKSRWSHLFPSMRKTEQIAMNGERRRTISTSTQKRIYLVTDSCSAELQCFLCTVYKFTYILITFNSLPR